MFADRLRALRTGQHLTLNQLAQALNRHFPRQHPNSSSQIDNWERGIRLPSYLGVLKLARYFHVSLDYLTGRPNTQACNLAPLFVADRPLYFGTHHLDENDRNEIYALIRGYFMGRSHRPGHHSQDQQQTLNLKP